MNRWGRGFTLRAVRVIGIGVWCATPLVALEAVDVVITPTEPDTTDRVSVSISGDLPDPCHDVIAEVEMGDDAIRIVLTLVINDAADVCGAVVVPFSLELPLGPLYAGAYEFRVEEAFGDAFATRLLMQTTLTVGECRDEAHEVEQLLLDKVVDATSPSPKIHITWLDPASAADYVLFEDTQPDGAFRSSRAAGGSGLQGTVITMPEDDRFYLVAGRNDECGVGHY